MRICNVCVFFASVSVSMAVLPADSAISERFGVVVRQFVSKGAETTLRRCNFSKPRCTGAKLLQTEDVAGESNDVKRIIRTVRFEGLEVALTIPLSSPSKYLVGKVEVTAASWPIEHGLRVGQIKSKVLEVLGPPSMEKDGCIEYFLEDMQSSASFCFVRDRISKILWERWID